VLETFTQQLAASRHLTDEQVDLAVERLVDEGVSAAAKADFLCHLAVKGETVQEITAFARALRARAIQPVLDDATRSRVILDVVGTGGDRLSTFNISTATALVAAAAGVLVAKHGNRASTSPIGSADVIEALGIPFELEPPEMVAFLKEHGFAFFFAPKYHPAFRHIIPARKLCAERGQTTIFNFLGPLLNPAQPSAMLVGVPRPELCEPFARVLRALGVCRGMVVCGAATDDAGVVRYLDEFSPLGPSKVAEFDLQHEPAGRSVAPELLPVQPAQLAELRGGGREINAQIIRRVLRGEERGPKRDAVLFNAAAALVVAGRAAALPAGWELAASLIDSGEAHRKLEELTG
jgi:anthranilate phosphoribosyltransferase